MLNINFFYVCGCCFIKPTFTRVFKLKALYTLPPGRPVNSDTSSTSLGSIRARCKKVQLLHENYLFTFLSLSIIAMYSFIQLNEVRRHGENKNAQALKQQQSGFEHRVSRLRVRHSTAIHKSRHLYIIIIIVHISILS